MSSHSSTWLCVLIYSDSCGRLGNSWWRRVSHWWARKAKISVSWSTHVWRVARSVNCRRVLSWCCCSPVCWSSPLLFSKFHLSFHINFSFLWFKSHFGVFSFLLNLVLCNLRLSLGSSKFEFLVIISHFSFSLVFFYFNSLHVFSFCSILLKSVSLYLLLTIESNGFKLSFSLESHLFLFLLVSSNLNLSLCLLSCHSSLNLWTLLLHSNLSFSS